MTKIDKVIEIINTYAKLKVQYYYTLDKLNTYFPKDIKDVDDKILHYNLELALEVIDIAKKLDMLKYELPIKGSFLCLE